MRMSADAGLTSSEDRPELEALVPLVYDQLRLLAHRQLRRRGGSETVSTTMLVHEAYLKLRHHSGSWQDRTHFLAVAALAMRQVLVDYARRRQAQKRRPHPVPVELAEWYGAPVAADTQAATVLELDEALTRLGQMDPRLARVIELRFFGGLSVEEAALVLEISSATVRRDTRVARAFLARELRS
jgi:RNA polymerase sigma factor (TIGR02999 family)